VLAILMGMTDVSVTAPAPATPQIASGPGVASTDAGLCSFAHTVTRSAAIRVSWTLTNPYGVTFEAKVYENEILVAVTTGLFYDKVISGQVENGSLSLMSDWTYRVDIVRISDGAVVDSNYSSAWQQIYGDCSGRDG
jgi:hypothetical protein